MKKGLLILICLVSLTGFSQSRDSEQSIAKIDYSKMVFRVQAHLQNGGIENGSAVSLGSNRFVTSCHTLINVNKIFLGEGSNQKIATLIGGHRFSDICFLSAEGLNSIPTGIAPVSTIKVGAVVTAVGYSEKNRLDNLGTYHESTGQIQELCQIDQILLGPFIRTDAAWNVGASGGGLFDEQGRLVGVLTFKSLSHSTDKNFAIPSSWIEAIASTVDNLPSPSLNSLLNHYSLSPFWMNLKESSETKCPIQK